AALTPGTFPRVTWSMPGQAGWGRGHFISYGSRWLAPRDARLWLYDLARGTLTPPAGTAGPSLLSWQPTANVWAFLSPLSGALNLYWMAADGSGPAERLTTSENFQLPGSRSPDGRGLAFTEADPTTGWDLWVLGLQGDPKPRPFVQTSSNEYGPM